MTSRFHRFLLAGFALSALVACQDAPTTPHVFAHPADGVLWVAISPPNGVPEAKSWHPYIKGAGARAAIDQVDLLQKEAQKARFSGDLLLARQKADEAMDVAARSMTRMPGPVPLLAAVAGLDSWADRARSALAEHTLPQLESGVAEVQAARAAAQAALQAGDTVAAVIHLSRAAETVHEHAPPAVALRALAHAERRLAESGRVDEDATRSLRLVRGAREALLAGDESRALQRALYALQLAERTPAAASAPRRREE